MKDNNIFARTELLLGEEALCILNNSHVAVFGCGGVGSYVVEALARTGVGHLTLVDGDIVAPSNINRQLFALHSTLGRLKVEVAAERVKDINPDIKVDILPEFYTQANGEMLDFGKFDYIVDAIDMVSAKLYIISRARDEQVPIISSMGTGNKIDPSKFTITDIYKTSQCPLARVMRSELRKRGIESLDVLFSTEIPAENKKPGVVGSLAFVPSVAGLRIAGHVIAKILGKN